MEVDNKLKPECRRKKLIVEHQLKSTFDYHHDASDKLGCAGFDSSLFLHYRSNWLDSKSSTLEREQVCASRFFNNSELYR